MKNSLFIAIMFTALTLSTSCNKPEGEKAEVSEATVATKAEGTALPVNLSSSIIQWEGAKPTATHTGTVKLSGGEIFLDGGDVTGGSFQIDMTTITDTDLKGDMKTNLENHLKGTAEGKKNDFFNVPEFPTASFEITKVTPVSGDDDATHLVYGNLTIKGVTNQIGFKALIGIGKDRVEVTTPPFTIDRIKWGVNFGSKTIFDNLGDKFINDEIGLTIKLKAGKELM